VRGADLKEKLSPLVVYLRPSTVSITVTSRVLDVLVVLDVVGGGVVVAPFVGTSPARTVTDIKPVRAIASTKRFMFLRLLWLMMQAYLYQKWEKAQHKDCKECCSVEAVKVNIRPAQVFTHRNTLKEGLSLEVGLTKAGHVASVA